MAFNQTERLPAAAEGIHRTLLAAIGKRLKRESLLARLRPGLSAGEVVIATTLAELRNVNAVVGEDEALQLRDDVDGWDQPGGMPSIVLRSIIQDAERRDLWEEDDGQLSLTGGIDFARAAAWFLTLPVQNGPWSWDGPHSVQQRQIDELDLKLIYNDTRWPFFVRWAQYLGVGSATGQGTLLPDPTRAVRPVLQRALGGRGAQPLTVVMRTLAQDLPILQGGWLHAALSERSGAKDSGTLSSALTFALMRLRREGVLELDEGRGDAEKVRFADGTGAFHAVRWIGGGA